VDGVETLVDFFSDFGFLFDGLELGDHFLDSLDSLFVILELILVKFLVDVCGDLAIHGFLWVKKYIH